MALAKFFDKTALAASHVLRGFDPQTFCETLEAKDIAVFFDKAAEANQEGRWTLELAINLLARLYPKLSIVCQDGSSFAQELSNKARAINPNIEISSELKPTSLCLVVGESVVPVNAPSIYVGSEGWITKVSSQGPVFSKNSTVPFGADAAACIGVANLFRTTFKEQLEDGRFDETWQMSLLDFDPTNHVPPNPAIGTVDFAQTYLVGLGAIGNGCIWSLSRIQGLRGTLHLVEDQVIELSNLQRYVLAGDSSIGLPKLELANEYLGRCGLNIVNHQHRWGEFLSAHNNWNLPRLAVAVDSARDRQAIQAALPEWIVNAWTQIGDLGISRHSFLANQACLACLYLPTSATKNEDDLVADAIGLPADKMTVRRMLVTNEPLDRAFILKIAEATKINVDELLQFEGQPLRAYYANAVCGGVMLRLGATADSQRRVEVPMAFQSALAGIFLAAELVAKASGLKTSPPPVTTKIDLLRPLGPYVSLPAPKHVAGNCICQDPDYIAVFKEKYCNAKLAASPETVVSLRRNGVDLPLSSQNTP